MTVPIEYRQASEEFDTLLQQVADATGLQTRHQAFTTLQGVLLAFRRRLDPVEGLRFVQVLPPLLRALFVADWNLNETPLPAGDQEAWLSDVKSLRRHHNISPDTAVADVATVLWARLDPTQLQNCLDALPPFALSFWSTDRRP